LNFAGGADASGSLIDGRYVLTVRSDRAGDINGADFSAFSATYGIAAGQTGFNAAFDFNNDGRIDIADFGQFSVRLFVPLP
jgi:hypothetical protein